MAKLNTAAQDALRDPLVRERLGALGLSFPEPTELSPAALAALQKAEIAKWWPIIKLADIKGRVTSGGTVAAECGRDRSAQASATQLNRAGRLERVKGIEPSSSAWKAVALPLSYTRAGGQTP